MKAILFSQALVGYELAFRARRLSIHTWSDYVNTYRKFATFLESDRPIDKITETDIRGFLSSQTTITAKTLLNYYTGLASLWTWALAERYVHKHIVRAVTPPKPEIRAIEPFSILDLKALLAALSRSRPYKRPGKVETSHSLQNQERNEAIILLLLDTGLRASELCELTMLNLDSRNRHIKVMGKGAKERIIPFSARTGRSIWRYLTIRPDDLPYQNVFMGMFSAPMDRMLLARTLLRLGDRASVHDCHPHRFRHTFAINYLRNGGDPYTLQIILGHTSMDMVQRYLRLSQIDFEIKHALASPVERMHL